jgi:transposase-like protein
MRLFPKPITYLEEHYARYEAMARAYLSGQYSMASIARHCGVHYSTVSRAVRRHEDETNRECVSARLDPVAAALFSG